MFGMRSTRRRSATTGVAAVEPLETRSLLSAVAPAIQFGDQAPEVQEEVSHSAILCPGNDDSTGLLITNDAANLSDGQAGAVIQSNSAISPGPVIVSPESGTRLRSREVIIEWQAVLGASGYEVRAVNTSGQSEREVAHLQHVTDTSAIVLAGQGQHLIRIRARMNDGTFSEWSERTFSVFVSRPTILTPYGDVSEPNPRVEWTPVPAAVAYDVWLGEDGRTVGTVEGHEGGTSMHLSDILTDRDSADPLIDGAQYRIWVRGVYSDGARTGWSPNLDFVKYPEQFHQPVSIVMPATQMGGRVTASWERPATDSGQPVRYDLYINTIDDRHTAIYRRSDLTELSHIVDLELDTGTYEVWVRAYFADGSMTRWGRPQKLNVTDSAVPPPRGRMQFQVPSQTDDLTPTIVWGDLSQVYDVEVERIHLLIRGASWYQRTHLPGTSREHTVEVPLNTDGTHMVWVRAFLADGSVSDWSGDGQIMIIGQAEIPFRYTRPTLSVSGGVASWDALRDADRYELWINEYDASGNLITARVFNNDHIRDLSIPLRLRSGHYRAWLRAVDSQRQYSRWSEEVSFTV